VSPLRREHSSRKRACLEIITFVICVVMRRPALEVKAVNPERDNIRVQPFD
jgi:hypothetical protein